MDYQIKNKFALIGGASKGLGKACALSLAMEGVNVAICARNKEILYKTADEIKSKTNVMVLPIVVDLSDTNNMKKNVIEKVQSKFDTIDIFVVNSGGPKPGTFFELIEDDWKSSYDSVLNYVIKLYEYIIPIMKENKWGRIINITSLSVKEPAESLVLSNVFRSAIVSLSKTISRELIKHNITINNVCPGAFKTDRAIELMNKRSKKTGETVEDIELQAVKSLPLGRYQDPSELGALIAYLSSEQACGLTGTTIQIDGGIYKGIF
jgi:3-oxoacyl-[acyl-carrier protein] reductase